MRDDSPRNKTETEIRLVCDEMADFLIGKNRAYGNSFENPMNIFSKLSAEDQLLGRIDDKLSRLSRGTEYVGDDTIKDLAGYLILLTVLKRRQIDAGKDL